MKFTLEQVDELRKRANVGYKEAREALEKFDGDLVDALAYLDEQNKTKCCGGNLGNSYMDTIKHMISKGNKTFMNISKKEMTILNIPVTIAVLVAIFATPIMVTGLLLALFTGCKIKFKKATGEDCPINQHLDKVSDIVGHTAEKFTQEIKQS